MGTLPPELYEQQQQLNRQQRMAQALIQQGQQMPQGQMVSGRFVPTSFFQNITPLVQTYLGSRMAEKGEKEALDIAKQLRQLYGDELKEFRTMMQGREATPERTTEMAGPFGEGVAQGNTDIPMPTAYMPARSAIQANPQAAYDFAVSAYNPDLRALGLKKLTEGPIKVGIDDVLLDPRTNQPIFKGAGKNPEKVQTAAIILGLDSKPRSEWTAQDRAAIDAQIQKAPPSVSINLGQKGFDNTLKLRSDFRSEPVYKGFQEIESAFNQINSGLNSKSPAGDLAAATKFMKLLDPTSVVRESELAMAMQASGALDRLYNYAQMRYAGTKLTPTQREDFRNLSNQFYATAYNQYTNKREEYSDIAKRNDLNIDDVVGKESKLKPPIVKPSVENAPRAILNNQPIIVKNGQWVYEKTGKPAQ